MFRVKAYTHSDTQMPMLVADDCWLKDVAAGKEGTGKRTETK